MCHRAPRCVIANRTCGGSGTPQTPRHANLRCRSGGRWAVRPGRVGAPQRSWAVGCAGRGPADRRRVRALGVHPVEGAAAAARGARRGEAHRRRAGEPSSGEMDVAAVLRRRDEVGVDERSGERGCRTDPLGGRATASRWYAAAGGIVDERRVLVGDEELEARRAVVLSGRFAAAGAGARGTGGPGARRACGRTARRRRLRRSRRRLVVVGAGPEGVEMAQAFQKLGSQVTLIEGAAAACFRSARGIRVPPGDGALRAAGSRDPAGQRRSCGSS